MHKKLKLFIILGILSAVGIGAVVVLRSGKEISESVSPLDAQAQGQESSSQASVPQIVPGSVTSVVHANQSPPDREEGRQMDEIHEDFTGGDGMDTNKHGDAESTEISAAIVDFQTKSRAADDYKTARKLLPLIKVGMTPQEVRAILGEPGRLQEDGRSWFYGLFYSQFIVVRFDSDEQVEKVMSSLLADGAQE